MLFPDKSPEVLLIVLITLLALALLAAARDLLRERGGGAALACPACGLPFDARRWANRNTRQMYHGRYTITPVYTCPRCGQTVEPAGS